MQVVELILIETDNKMEMELNLARTFRFKMYFYIKNCATVRKSLHTSPSFQTITTICIAVNSHLALLFNNKFM